MKIAMIARSTLFSSNGGDTIQLTETARELRLLGVTVDVRLSHEQIDYAEYDFLHFFNVGRPADILRHTAKSKTPYVVSTIYVDYAEFDLNHRRGVSGSVLKKFSADGVEYVKTLSRWVAGNDERPPAGYLFKGQRQAMKEVLDNAAMLLPNSRSEYRRLAEKFDLQSDYRIIPNGVDSALFLINPPLQKDPDLILCVARIEGIKNQLNLIKALNGLILWYAFRVSTAALFHV